MNKCDKDEYLCEDEERTYHIGIIDDRWRCGICRNCIQTCIYKRGRQKNKTPHRCFSILCGASVERRNHQELNPYEKRYRWTQHRNEKLRRCNKFLEHIISLTCCIFFPRSSSHCRDSNVVLHIHEKHIGKSLRHKCAAFIMC